MRTYSAEQITRGVAFAWAYQRKLRAYLHKDYVSACGRGGPRPDHPSFVHFVLAAELADRMGEPFEDYVEAHFWAEHRFRGRHPQARFLHSEGGFSSAERIAAWKQARARANTGRVLAEGRIERGSKRERTATQERYLTELCQKWSATPEDVLRALGGPEAGVFDPAWLRHQPVWRALNDAGYFEEHPGPDIALLERCRKAARADIEAPTP